MSHTTTSNKILFFLCLLLLLLAFLLRTYQLDGQALRGDEAATVHYAALPISDLWELSRITDPHPPLYYLLLHPWRWLLGDDAWLMRYAGVMASVLAVAVLYRLSRYTLRSAAVSLLATFLLAVNPFQIWLAQDVRSYPFFTLLGLLSSWALWQALTGRPSSRGHHQEPNPNDTTSNPQPTNNGQRTTDDAPRFTFYVLRFTLLPWLLYIILTVACLYIHYYTIFLIVFQALFVLLNARRFWPQRGPWLASQVAIGLLIMPGLQLAYNFIGQAAGGIDTIPTTEILRRTSAALLTGFTLDPTRSVWVSLLLAPVWIVGLIILLRRNLTMGSFWALFFAIPVLGVITLSIDRPFFKERFLIQAQPAFELLLATGFITLAQIKWPTATPKPQLQPPTHHVSRFSFYVSRFTSLFLLAFLLSTNLLTFRNYHTAPTYVKAPPWHLYHDYVSDHTQPGDVMLTNFPEAAVSYYSPDALPFYVVPDERDLPTSARLETTENIAGAYERIWFLPLLRQGFDEHGDVLNWLDRHADRVDQVFFPVYNVNLYLSPPTLEAQMIRQPATFTHGIHLRGYQIFDEQGHSRLTRSDVAPFDPILTLAPADEFTLSLYWQADGPTTSPYTVFTHLIAADGFTRTGQDNQPVWGSYPTTAWQPDERITDKYNLTLPDGTPPGDHRLRLGWYHAESSVRVSLVDSDVDQVVLDVVVRVENRRE